MLPRANSNVPVAARNRSENLLHEGVRGEVEADEISDQRRPEHSRHPAEQPGQQACHRAAPPFCAGFDPNLRAKEHQTGKHDQRSADNGIERMPIDGQQNMGAREGAQNERANDRPQPPQGRDRAAALESLPDIGRDHRHGQQPDHDRQIEKLRGERHRDQGQTDARGPFRGTAEDEHASKPNAPSSGKSRIARVSIVPRADIGSSTQSVDNTAAVG